jgi:hypothetical protein
MHVNAAVDETRREESFCQDDRLRAVMPGKRWLLLTDEAAAEAAHRRRLQRPSPDAASSSPACAGPSAAPTPSIIALRCSA